MTSPCPDSGLEPRAASPPKDAPGAPAPRPHGDWLAAIHISVHFKDEVVTLRGYSDITPNLVLTVLSETKGDLRAREGSPDGQTNCEADWFSQCGIRAPDATH